MIGKKGDEQSLTPQLLRNLRRSFAVVTCGEVQDYVRLTASTTVIARSESSSDEAITNELKRRRPEQSVKVDCFVEDSPQ